MIQNGVTLHRAKAREQEGIPRTRVIQNGATLYRAKAREQEGIPCTKARQNGVTLYGAKAREQEENSCRIPCRKAPHCTGRDRRTGRKPLYKRDEFWYTDPVKTGPPRDRMLFPLKSEEPPKTGNEAMPCSIG